MKKPLVLALSVIIVIVLLVLAFYAGFLVQQKKTALRLQETALQLQKANRLISLSSFGSISISGRVMNISDREITVEERNDTVTVRVEEDTIIMSTTSLQPGDLTIPTAKDISFEDIKVNDDVSIALFVSDDGSVRVVSVMVIYPVTEN